VGVLHEDHVLPPWHTECFACAAETFMADETSTLSTRETEPIYRRPHDYDLEHEGDDDDIQFYKRLLSRLRPRRVLELACGSGRVVLPLAELAATEGLTVVGLELADEMLAEAQRKRAAAAPEVQQALRLVHGDMRSWTADEPFDLIITPCSSLTHLLTIDDQLATWRTAHRNLAPGGRFVADIAMPNLGAFVDAARTPARLLVEVDLDATQPDGRTRLVRYKTTRYLPHEQRAEIRFLYDRFDAEHVVDRYLSDFESHVYFPREVQLLFMMTGFEIEQVYGSYFERALRPTSREMIMVGRRMA
jgi:SAM-dependent methyltransferase